MTMLMLMLMYLVLAQYIFYIAAAVEENVPRLATANTSTDMLPWACKKYCCSKYNIWNNPCV